MEYYSAIEMVVACTLSLLAGVFVVEVPVLGIIKKRLREEEREIRKSRADSRVEIDGTEYIKIEIVKDMARDISRNASSVISSDYGNSNSQVMRGWLQATDAAVSIIEKRIH